MKKILVVLMAAVMTAALAGCNNSNSSSNVSSSESGSSAASSTASSSAGSSVSSENGLKEGKTIKDFVSAMNDAFEGIGGQEIDDSMLKDLYTVDSENVEEYAGNMSLVNVLAYDVLVVKAKEGKLDAVRSSLEMRKQNRIAEFEFYPVNGNDENTKNALVVTSGDYAILVICDDYEKAQTIIDEYFN